MSHFIFEGQHANSSYKFYGLVLLFVLFLMPISISVRGDNVSGNYLFILFPLITLILGQKINVPPKPILALLTIYFLIFITCSIYQLEYIKFWDRRLISFILFISIFTFFFIEIDKKMSLAFKYAIILSSVLYSFHSIYFYFLYNGPSLPEHEIRALIQSQRYGFILLFGFWLLVFEKTKTLLGSIIKILLIFSVFNGLGFTFSRSSVAGLLISSGCLFLLLFLKPSFYQIKDWPKKNLYVPFLYIFIGMLIVAISYQLMPSYFQYFSGRLFKISIVPFVEPSFFPPETYPIYDTNVWLDRDTSEGYRIFMIGEVFKFLSNNPLFGSGYLGVWIMFEDLAGAAHNQLLDTLFRTGLIGFSAFIFLLYKIFKFNLNTRDWAVIVSLIGILIIGMFHETFKLSQGAFLFSFLAAQAFNSPEVKSNSTSSSNEH